jgi:hypothetical protein
MIFKIVASACPCLPNPKCNALGKIRDETDNRDGKKLFQSNNNE